MIKTLRGIRHFSTAIAMKQAVSELCVTVPWGQIRGRVWGPDHGRPVLCLHGWADNSGTFNTLIPLLPKEWRYVAVDLVGHGLSSHRPDGVFYTFPAYLADVRRVLEALQWKRFSIIGHSMGGNVAGLFSAVYPEMVESLVLLDSFGFLPSAMKHLPGFMRRGVEEMVEFEKEKEERGEKVYMYEKAVERLMTANPTLSEQSVHILLERGCKQVEGGVVFNRDHRINLTNILRFSLEHSLEFQSRIQARVLVVLAEEGFKKVFSAPEQEKLMSDLLKGYTDQGGSVVIVPGDHHVHLNSPETVAQIVTDYLQAEASPQAMPWLFLDWFVPLYLLVSVLVLAGFGACLYFLEPGLQDAHKWSSQSAHRRPLVTHDENCSKDDDHSALI
ncbi:hypothetical protein AAFF_G00260910 [Aldrovandia affinis]|uniref:AB hydrolase-1 domain-containing protein n=1 Tax=Aldrovandia affinis TaxID=143900 RepID=A0AAD7W392_9TELE|nr:hypothetical protein AAFF_G00260910 [Aldrovandia affinis]